MPAQRAGRASRAAPHHGLAPPEPLTGSAADRLADLARVLFAAPEASIWLTGKGYLDGPGADGIEVVPDASRGPRPAGEPPVVGGQRPRFYAAAPLWTRQGRDLGVLHIASPDPRPESLAAADRRRVEALAGIAVELLDTRSHLRLATEALAEKDLLAREADHRVANGLQLLHGALSLQASTEPAVASRTALQVAAHRVAAVAGAHRHLYCTAGTTPGTAAYLAALVRELAPPAGPAGGAAERPIALNAEPGAEVPAGLLPRLGLIAAELVANALKHGTGRIAVELRPLHPLEGDGLMLAVSDEGPGFPPGFDPAAPARKSLGMRLVAALAQPGGAWIDPGDRRRIMVRFVNGPAPGRPR